MNKRTEAVFRDGVLRPIEPLQIAENETVRILVLPQCTSPDASASGPLTLQEVDAILREIDAMPDLPSEPRENVAVEHDRYLYGDKSKFACLFRNRRVGTGDMIFVDTGAWFTLFIRQAPDHVAVRQWFRRNHHEPLLPTDYVVDETLTLMRSRGARPQSIAFADFVFVKRSPRLHFITRDEILAALAVFRQFADKDWSFTDCTSRVVMQQLGVATALALDRHFSQFGTVTVVP